MFKFIHSFRDSLFFYPFLPAIRTVLFGIYIPALKLLGLDGSFISFLKKISKDQICLQPNELSNKAALPFSPIIKTS